MYVYMYVCVYVLMYCLYVMVDSTNLDVNALAQGIKSFLASQVLFQAVAGARTYGTDSFVITSLQGDITSYFCSITVGHSNSSRSSTPTSTTTSVAESTRIANATTATTATTTLLVVEVEVGVVDQGIYTFFYYYC